ncbi:MAG: cation:proton antiporter [Bacilli bacterium]|nr:cation:proton antiporter [Bacilli bacterium]
MIRENILLVFSLILILGLFSTRLMKLVNFPNVTGYLIIGLLVGPYCLKLINENNIEGLKLITNVALGFIAFSIGGEFKLTTLKSLGKNIMIITLFQAVTTSLLTFIVLWAVGTPMPIALCLCAIAAATAPAATLMVVRQYKAKGPVTDTLLPVVALDDAIGLMIFSLCFALAKVIETGGQLTITNVILMPILEIVLSLGIGALIGFVLAIVMKFFKSRANRLIWMIACVFLGVALCEIMPIELSSLLVCMMIGAVFTNMRSDSISILDGGERWTPPLFMLFFIISGAELDLAILPTVGVIGISYLIARSLGKVFGSTIGAKVVKADKNIVKYLGLTLLPQAGVAIGMAQMVSVSLGGSVGEKVTAVVLCATLIYELVGPLITKIALTKAGEIKKKDKVSA